MPLNVRIKSCSDKNSQNKLIFGESIEERPDKINNQIESGHWEIDTVVGKKEPSSMLLSLDKRLTRKRHLVKITS